MKTTLVPRGNTSRCDCHLGRTALPPILDPEYEAYIAPLRAARIAELTDLTWGMCDYRPQPNPSLLQRLTAFLGMGT